jgi:hypothetical protein
VGSAAAFLLVLLVVATPLWWLGPHPLQIVDELLNVLSGERLIAPRELVVLSGFGGLWLLLIAGLVRTVNLVIVVAVRAVRLSHDSLNERSSHRVIRALLIFAIGLVTTTKAVSHSPTIPAVPAAESDDSRRSIPLSTPVTLPALASAGLAAGLAAHVNKTRAVLLNDAPTAAKLRRPAAAALSRGTAVFESAQRWSADAGGKTTADHIVDATALLVPLGRSDTNLVHLTIAPGDKVSVEAPLNEAVVVLRHVINTVMLAPWLPNPHLVLCGFSAADVVGGERVVLAHSSSEAVAQALALRDRDPTQSILVVSRYDDPEFGSLSGAGIAVITGCAMSSMPTTRVIREQRAWRITPHDDLFLPYGVTAEEAADFRAMIREMTVIEIDNPTLTTINVEYSALIRVLGPVEVVDNNHSEVQFRKSKSLELLCWLSLHRDRPTVSAARTALWEVDVEDATFHNVLSELRRGLNSHGITDAAWRATKQRLALDPLIFTDAELFRRVLLAIDDDESELSTARALEELCGVLALVRGLPFAGEDYAWADAEGITSTFVWLVTRAVETATQLAKHLNDDAALLAAATAGLRMMPGDERFSQLRDDSVSAAAKNAFKAPAGNTQHGFANDRLAHL